MAYTDIDKPSDYFNTVLYTGNATDDHSITGVGFQPDWVWVKGRSEISSHRLNDSVRGAGKELLTNTTGAEYTYSPNTSLKSFDSDGFTLGTDNGINKSSVTYASWNWLASNTTASNTDGSITSTVSANTTSGFSIVSYTGNGSNGASFGHGLGVKPKIVLIKNRTTAKNWVYWQDTTNNGTSDVRLVLNLTSANYNNLHVTFGTSTITLGNTDDAWNKSGDNLIAYCFAEKKGFSKFGSYTGNGSSDGTFVYTGFKPAFVMVKRSNTTGSWIIFDNKRNTFNPEDKFLYPNLTNAEGTLTALDFVSNGFKFRNADTFWNASGSTYIYLCFAENPFTTSTGIPTTAR